MTTGGFSSKQLLEEGQLFKLPSLTNSDAIEIGEIATTLGNQRKVPIAIQVRIGGLDYFPRLPTRIKT